MTTPARQMNKNVVAIEGKKIQYHVDRINEAWQSTVTGVIRTGQYLIEAKKDLPHGSFEAMLRTELNFTPGTARRLMAIADNPVLSNRSHVNDLPAQWGTLYQLTKIEPNQLQKMIEDKTIRPAMERKEVVEWIESGEIKMKSQKTAKSTGQPKKTSTPRQKTEKPSNDLTLADHLMALPPEKQLPELSAAIEKMVASAKSPTEASQIINQIMKAAGVLYYGKL